MTNGNTPDQAALGAADSVTRVQSITLENGIVLRLKPVPPLALRSAAAHISRPEIPQWTNPDKGTTEPNPYDPDYLAAVAQWREDVAQSGLTVAILLGTEVESVPAGLVGPEDDSWIDAIEEVNALAGSTIDVHRTGRARYLDWVRLYAIPSQTDLFTMTRVLTLGVALSEKEVADAAESFRRLVAGTPDPVVPDPAADIERDRD